MRSLLCLASKGMGLYIILCFMSGRSLQLVEADCISYSKQMKDMNRQQTVDLLLLLHQMTQNLTVKVEDPGVIQGNVIPDAKQFRELYKDIKPMIGIMNALELRLCATFGLHEKGANLFLACGFDFAMQSPGHPLFMNSVFSGGLSCFEMARTSKKRAYKKHAIKAQKTIKGWLKMKNPNVQHLDALLDAEMASLAGKKKAKIAEQFYQSAIAKAARGGFVHDAALVNERYGEFMLAVQSDKDGAVYYFEQAIKFYEEWGATKKVEMLRERSKEIVT
jgi:hypothetical protein